MAHFLRLKLRAVCSSRLPSPALASKLFKSPDSRLTLWRWYGEGALLEDRGDGGSMAANQEESLANGSEEGATEGTSKSAKDDKWQKMVNSVRSMAHKKKLKAGHANNSGSLKAGETDSQFDFLDLDLPQTEGVFQGPTVSRKELLALNTFSKSNKQKTAQSQSLNQSKSKDSAEFFSSKNVLFDSAKKAKQQQHNSQLSQQELSNVKRQAFDDMRAQFKDKSKFCEDPESAIKESFSKDSDDVFPFSEDLDPTSRKEASKGFLSRKMAHQASSNSDGVSKQAYMVCIHNLPPSCNPSMVKACMAIHGEVAGVFKKPVRDRLSAYIQFKTVEAMESALASRKLQLGSKICYVTRADNSVFTTVVRVSKVGNDTDESQLRSVCEQFGKVDDVRKRAYGVFDVFYDVKELMNIPSILASLSEVNLNRSTWFALPAPLVHPSMQKEVMKSLDGQSWRDIQVNNAINRIEAGLDAVSVLFEDLKQLNSVAREYSKVGFTSDGVATS
ncbi:hypothetical protein L7F22_014021 [Adiantum nelumboides]|nr:hypothetical protein [Adiantum nelumboides]